jgi:hypothetical protein
MTRKVYRFDKKTGEILPDDARQETGPRTHSVHGDTMDVTFNHSDCKYYDSKSQFRKATRAAGCHEVGNDYENTEAATKHFQERRRETLTKIEWGREFKENCERYLRRK